MTNDTPRHPARYTKAIIPIAAEILARHRVCDVIDIFAGTGERIAALRDYGWVGLIYANEIEREWARLAPFHVWMTVGDSQTLPHRDGRFESAFTSVTYGNRMADHHRARDTSRRNTYTHALGRTLGDGNTGAMHFTGKRRSSLDYCTKHKRCYSELRRVLADGAIFILNVSDHIRKGRRVRTTLWHRLTLQSLGFEVIEEHRIETPRLRHGANSDKRVGYESIIVFRLTKGDDKLTMNGVKRNGCVQDRPGEEIT